MQTKQLAIGIDLGGTNARAALVDSTGHVIQITQTSSKEIQKPSDFLSWVAKAKQILTRPSQKIAGVGIGFPGSVDVSRGMVHSLTNLSGWKNQAIAKQLQNKLKNNVCIDNDANAMALGEFYFGAAKGASNAVFLTLGTGVGGGLVINGQLFRGATFSAAEIGHMRAGFSTIQCACGKIGCIETEIGNNYLLRKVQADISTGKLKSRIVESLIHKSEAKIVTLEILTKAAALGDAYCIAFWKQSGERLGNFLSGICNLLNPEVIVLGGGVMGAGKFLLNPIRSTIKQQAFQKASLNVKVVKAKFGNKAGLVGAAALIMRKP